VCLVEQILECVLEQNLLVGSIVLLTLFITFAVLKWAFGTASTASEKYLRGARLIDTKALAKLTRKEPHILSIGGVPIPRKLEPFHFQILGSTGTGKSVAFSQILSAVRQRNHRAIVVDLGGHYLEHFFEKGDLVLNPFDSRDIGFSPLNEVHNLSDFEALAAALVPTGTGQQSEWSGYVQTLVSACLKYCFETGQTAPRDLAHLVLRATTDSLFSAVQGTPAARFFEKGNDRMLGSILSIMSSQLRWLAHLQTPTTFSIRDWVQNDQKNWLFLTVREDQIPALKSLIAAQISIATTALLSLPVSPTRRVFFMLDELASMGKVHGLEALLTKSRKAGGVTVVGLQSVSQLKEVYGRDHAQTLLSCLSNSLCLRAADPDSSEHCSKLIGKTEILETRTGESTSDGKTSKSKNQSRSEKFAVMSSELLNLPDRQGFLTLAGDYPTAKVDLQLPNARQAVVAPFVARPTALQMLGGQA
jgi:hypothetical protein